MSGREETLEHLVRSLHMRQWIASVIAAEDLRPPADIVEDSLAETTSSHFSVP